MKLFFSVFLITSFSNILANNNFPKLNISKDSITLSGISSGAFFAHQFHIAHSSIVKGAALFAGGPYNCSKGQATKALYSCMKISAGKPNETASLNKIKFLSMAKNIDSIKNLKNDKVLIYRGTEDSVVDHSVSKASFELYKKLKLRKKNIRFIDDLKIGHAFPTVGFGNPCHTPAKSPFISQCNYDAAKELLSYFYGPLKDKDNNQNGAMLKFDQTRYFGNYNKSKLFMQNKGLAFIPNSCDKNTKCKLHIAFHGCSQTTDDIDLIYSTKTGLNEWASSNNIVVLYPQAKKSKSKLHNPYGCWDWWGYTGSDYYTKNAKQISVVKRTIDDLLR